MGDILSYVIFHVQLFQLRLSDPTQAYATRPKGSVGSCKSDLVQRLSEVGREL